ncbi:cyclin-D1-1-like [Corylus avellana]|uniref:cyclin-D1-1-like n=1 Tax=Corylus avellana TaxID=13451 RepID=UPI00286CFFCE|nr:cyclin-D1-1-like [Corylus avellana]
MSSLFSDYSTSPTLYCSEVAADVVSSNAHVCEDHEYFHTTLDWLPDDESSIVGIFDSENHQMLEIESIHRLRGNTAVVGARKDSVNWMLKVHAYYNFRPETAYLSVNYMDCFLASHTLPQGKGWPLQLLSVACLALAAKMEETSVPLLLDLQVKGNKFLFKPKTVQRMELLVMSNLKWRLRRTTPFDFLHYFVAKLSCQLASPLNDCSQVLSRASDLIISTCHVIDFLDYPPSSIAAAAVLCATDQNMEDQEYLSYFHMRVSKELVKKCRNLMKQKKCLLPHIKQQKLQPSPVGMLDAAIGRSCNGQRTGLTRI